MCPKCGRDWDATTCKPEDRLSPGFCEVYGEYTNDI